MNERGAAAPVAYKSPPVTETSLGIQFAPLSGWDVNLFGLFSERVRESYPKFQSAPPAVLDTQTNLFLIGVPKIRGIYSSGSATDVVQIQDDFFFVNWRKMSESSIYPRYANVRSNFVDQWTNFRRFLVDNGLAAPLIQRYQVTYVNHAVEGEITPGDLLTNWTAPVGSDPFGFALSTTYRIGERNVDVTIAMQPAVRTLDNTRVTQTTITTSRSLVTGIEDADPALTLDEMHDALIETFQATTSDGAKSHWGAE
jgi:uncharacterized protein (TIGR04255 family)